MQAVTAGAALMSERIMGFTECDRRPDSTVPVGAVDVVEKKAVLNCFLHTKHAHNQQNAFMKLMLYA